MSPSKVRRERVAKLEDLPNIGKAMAADLRAIGISAPAQLAGRNAYQLFAALCRQTGVRQDPCVLDTFLSIVHFMDGGDALPWWAFTRQRKLYLAGAAIRGGE